MKKAGFCLMLLLLASCGPGMDKVTVTLLTPFGMKKEFHDLKQMLFSPSPESVFLNNTYCLEDQLAVGVNQGIGSQVFTTQKIKLKFQSIPTPTCNINDLSACLSSYSYLEEPIQISLPKGIPVEVALTGPVYNPIDSDNDGNCDSTTNSIPNFANDGVNLLGHTIFQSNESSVVPLQVWLINSYTNPNPTVLYSNNSSNANMDFIKIKMIGTNCINSIDYFKDINSQSLIHHELRSASSLTANHPSGTPIANYYVTPRIFPFQINFIDGTTQIAQDLFWTTNISPCSASLESF